MTMRRIGRSLRLEAVVALRHGKPAGSRRSAPTRSDLIVPNRTFGTGVGCRAGGRNPVGVACYEGAKPFGLTNWGVSSKTVA